MILTGLLNFPYGFSYLLIIFFNFRSGNNCYSEAYPSMNKGLAATYPAGKLSPCR